jgi:magnesium-transporting ATPase (P-type)
MDCIVYNCDARIEMSIEGFYEPEGNGIEAGMLRFIQDNDIEAHELLVKKNRECIIETVIPFDPTRKRQVVIIRPGKDSKYVRVVIKGAPEFVMPLCTKVKNITGDDDYVKVDERDKLLKERIIDPFCA